MENHDKAREKADQRTDEDVIELTDTVDISGEQHPTGDDAVLEDGEDFIELTELAEVPPAPEGTATAPTDEQVQQALHSVVKELYAEKIERLLFEVVEETVTREIDKIKRLLLDGRSDTDK